MKILSLAANFKDWLILITLVILLWCILEIRKLKKNVAREVQKRILPQLSLEFNSDVKTQSAGFYLKNESFFLAREIRFDDVEVTLDDLGYQVGLILKFDEVDAINPQEKVKLNFKVFDKTESFLPEVTERIIPHLIHSSFRVKVYYSNIENLKSRVVFLKKKGKFYTERIESYQ